jgi:saccharopine dehydrogenase-like NADP-dependent oxidoreductase
MVKSEHIIYNICYYQECYKETGAQAVSYNIGVSTMIGIKLMYNDKWSFKDAATQESNKDG